eukprot:CAMPEP_0172395072 /NCGR_PEP_ID=MMETSP1061-20121228/17939_1 /TAXON_ID=37318 /ORGANISM="Pseudo-nitzschia pungens, Strain cf. pungens" /LENGTH=847 /DNA_ID=CAMNT_0013126553 /DNA_START=235 /DNA_END=2778 /DNA_ORIENTATION=-
MWGALKKDFGEFVSTVASETTETLETIDKTLDEPIGKRSAVSKTSSTSGTTTDDTTEETDTKEALIDPDTGLIIDDLVGDDDDDDDDDEDDEFSWKSPEESPTADEMRQRLVNCEDVFRDPLLSGEKDDEKDTEASGEEGEEEKETETETPAASTNPSDAAVRAFLDTFDVAAKTEEISKLLEEDIALKTTFSIVATDQSLVTYADFWTRYFYRIASEDENRLKETYASYYEKHLAAFQQRKEAERAAAAAAASNNLGSGFSSFFGGVVNRLTHESDSQPYDTSGYMDESADQTEDGDDDVAPKTGLGGFLSSVTGGGGGRPPFVMNTAISDDDDDDEEEADEEEEDEDSEVELGWDDEDDEDFDELDDDDDEAATGEEAVRFRDDDDRSETVDFKDAEKEGLLEELDQARAERDALQKTVQMQAEELKKASLVAKPSAVAPLPVDDSADEGSADAAIHRLKVELFEKDSELAALRAKLEDVHEAEDDEDENQNQNENEKQHQQEIERLTRALADKDLELESLRTSTELESLRNSSANDQFAEQQKQVQAEQEIKAMSDLHNEETAKLRDECQKILLEKNQLQANLQSRIEELERTLASQQEQAAASVQEKETSTPKATADAATETAALTEELASKDQDIASLKTQLEDCQRQLAESAEQGTRDLSALRAKLQSQIDSLSELGSRREEEHRNELQQLTAEYNAAVQTLQDRLNDNQAVLSVLQVATPEEASELQFQLASSRSELQMARRGADKARRTAEALQAELDKCKSQLATASTVTTTNAPSSPGSNSTGVQIQLPINDEAAASIPALETAPATPSAAEELGLEPSENDGDNDHDDDDGWGDDW